MSIEILSLHKENKIYTDIYVLPNFSHLLVSSHYDLWEDVTDEEIKSLINLDKSFREIKKLVWNRFGLITKISSCVRSLLTNTKIGGSKSSQHMFLEAFDLHFYKIDGKTRVYEKKILLEIFEAIDEKFGKKIVQLFRYSWGIHVGFFTERKQVTYRRGAL